MKYKELPAFEINQFQKGDRARVYRGDKQEDVIVEEIRVNGMLLLRSKDIYDSFAHFKQCRKLEELKPREWTVFLTKDGRITSAGALNFCEAKWLRVREVLED